MIRTLGLALIAAFAAGSLPAHDCCGHHDCCDHEGYHHGWQDGQQQGQHCWRQWTAAAAVETLQGTVAEVNPSSDSPIVEIWLKSAKNTALVRLAPESFLKQNGFNLKSGDTLSITGYWANPGNELFIARELELAGKKLVIRSGHGRPAW